jgi:general secretion pathway protein D
MSLTLLSPPAITRAQSTAPQTPPGSQPASPSDTAPKSQATSTPAPPDKHAKRQNLAADDAYLAGARLLARREFAAAETQFGKALTLNPRNPDYLIALSIAHEHRVTDLVQQAGKARLLGHNAAADSFLAQARALDPQNAIVAQHIDPGPLPAGFTPKLNPDPNIDPNIDPGRAPNADPNSPLNVSIPAYKGPIVLAPSTTPQSFHLHANVQQVVTNVATKFGIRTVFDPSVTSQSVRFDLDDTTYTQAMPILLQMGHLMSVTLDQNSILVAKDNPENRQHFERLYEETIFIPALTVEQMTELGTVIRQIFDLRQVTVQNSIGTIVVRAPGYVLDALNLTLADLIDGGAQVMLDLKLYAIDKTHSRTTGAQLPQQVGVYNVASAAQNLVSQNQSLVNQAIASGLIPANASNITIALALIASGLVQSTLLTNTVGFFGGGITLTGVTTNVNPTFTLALNSSETRALDDIQLRIGDRQSATFRAGSRYPITTSTYQYPTSSAVAGATINGQPVSNLLSQLASATIPQIQYEDLGLTLKATPTVQKSNNVTVKLDFKIEALAGTALNNIPILASRQFTSDITIADGETALFVSGVTRSESAAVSGFPGLAELPGFQGTVSDENIQRDSSDLILLITPHIVRRRSSIIAGPRIALNLPPSE